MSTEIEESNISEDNDVQTSNLVLDKVDFEMLYTLYEDERVNSICSYRIKDICDAMQPSTLSYHTYSKRLKNKLIPLGYVNEGIRDSRSRTYYITSKGIDVVKNQIDESEE